MDAHPSAPPVVAVVITCDAGPWLEDALLALGAQDYPNFSVLVIDAHSDEDPTPRVAAILPQAYVRRLPERVGFSRAANEVLGIVEGASHYLFCHDDVAPAPSAVRIMLEEAFRSNAAIVAPKVLTWDSADRLLSVGQSADKTGVPADLVERGELDQEQYDAVRDVFCAPGGCTLVRADLFHALGGFDQEVDLFGEDLNLSWRAQVAGGRVVVAPDARVAHVEAIQSGRRPGWEAPSDRDRMHARAEHHRVRTILTCYGRFHLVRVVPQALFLSLVESLVELFRGQVRNASAVFLAWPRALRYPDELAAARRAAQGHRAMSDGEVRRLQSRGSVYVRALVRGRGGGAEDERAPRLAGQTGLVRSGGGRLLTGAWVITIGVLLIGSRGLIGHRIPGVGTLPLMNGGPGGWWRQWWSGWRPQGLGSSAPAPTALALLGLGGTVLLGGVGILQQLLVLGPLFLGPLGIFRATRKFGSALGRAAALVIYAAVPLSYNALAGGRWAGLIVYAAAPWLLAWLCRLTGEEPFVARPRWPARVVALGLLVALTGAFVPAILVVVPLLGIGLAAGSLLARRLRPGLWALAGAAGATLVATVLLLPWAVDALGSRTSLFGVSLGTAGRLGLGDVLRFHTGRVGGTALTWGFLVAAALPLLIGRSWRLAWAARLWCVALVCWGVIWAAGRGWLPGPVQSPEVLLAPAAAALALSTGLGAVAFELDLPGYRFGWRQLACGVAAAAVFVGSLAAVGAAGGGRWRLPQQGVADPLAFVSSSRPQGAFRVLWVGDPGALPLGSWRLADGVGYATSVDGEPNVADTWAPADDGATPRLAEALRLAEGGQTTSVGHLLAPMAVRYIVLPSMTAPSDAHSSPVPVPGAILSGLSRQVDLRTVSTDSSVTVYENAAWAPGRAVLTPQVAAASQSQSARAVSSTELTGSQPVLAAGSFDHFTGRLPADARVLVAGTDSDHWQLSAGGRSASRRPAFGTAMLFSVAGQGGKASLRFGTPVGRRLVLLLQVALWLVAVGLVITDRRRRQPGDEPESELSVPAGWLDDVTLQPVLATSGRRRTRRVAEPVGVDSDELWS